MCVNLELMWLVGSVVGNHMLADAFQFLSSEFVIQRSSIGFSDIGGCVECLKEIDKLLLYMRHSALFSRLGVRPPQGFLLHGPPGCGKTLIANAVAGVCL